MFIYLFIIHILHTLCGLCGLYIRGMSMITAYSCIYTYIWQVEMFSLGSIRCHNYSHSPPFLSTSPGPGQSLWGELLWCRGDPPLCPPVEREIHICWGELVAVWEVFMLFLLPTVRSGWHNQILWGLLWFLLPCKKRTKTILPVFASFTLEVGFQICCPFGKPPKPDCSLFKAKSWGIFINRKWVILWQSKSPLKIKKGDL